MTYPFDVTRTLLASQGRPKVCENVLDAAREVARARGARRGLYAGLSVTLAEIIPASAVQFGSYAALKTRFPDVFGGECGVRGWGWGRDGGGGFRSTGRARRARAAANRARGRGKRRGMNEDLASFTLVTRGKLMPSHARLAPERFERVLSEPGQLDGDVDPAGDPNTTHDELHSLILKRAHHALAHRVRLIINACKLQFNSIQFDITPARVRSRCCRDLDLRYRASWRS